jgi:phospholipid/cholesterol/gamma-HCH transport system ATP-binding protein
LINWCRREWNVSGVVISHEIPEVFQVADRVAMLLGGRIAAEGSPSDIQSSSDPAIQQFLRGSTHGPIKIQ